MSGLVDGRRLTRVAGRAETIEPRHAVREHPELAGTYLNLRAAELAARALRDPQDQRRFVAQVRLPSRMTLSRANRSSRSAGANAGSVSS